MSSIPPSVESDQTASSGADRPLSAPPYVSWTTVLNAIERMESEGETPSRLDRSYLKNMPGSTQAQFRHACRWLGLVDATDAPTVTLMGLVGDSDGRRALVKSLIHQHYPGPLSLPRNATQQQLEEQFREMGAGSAETLRKTIAFFLHACRYAEIELSPQFTQPKQPRSASAGGTRKPRRKNSVASAASQDDTTANARTDDAPNIIRDLLTKLPPEGSKWQRSKVEQWLGIARLTFEMVYELEGEYSNQLAPDAGLRGDGS